MSWHKNRSYHLNNRSPTKRLLPCLFVLFMQCEYYMTWRAISFLWALVGIVFLGNTGKKPGLPGGLMVSSDTRLRRHLFEVLISFDYLLCWGTLLHNRILLV